MFGFFERGINNSFNTISINVADLQAAALEKSTSVVMER